VRDRSGRKPVAQMISSTEPRVSPSSLMTSSPESACLTSALPLLEQFGIATAAEVNVDTFGSATPRSWPPQVRSTRSSRWCAPGRGRSTAEAA
jgi:hypothetical protein